MENYLTPLGEPGIKLFISMEVLPFSFKKKIYISL